MSLPAEEFRAASVTMIGRDLTPAADNAVQSTVPRHFTRLRQLHADAARIARTTPTILSSPHAVRGLEAAIVEAMFACLAAANFPRDRLAWRRQSEILRRFQEVVEAHPDEPLYLADICKAVAVNERTLLLCCQEHLGVSPKRFLMLRRLHRVRRDLRRLSPEAASVTDVATRHGFWELGRFAGYYQRTFGETPSVTLRRPAVGSIALLMNFPLFAGFA